MPETAKSVPVGLATNETNSTTSDNFKWGIVNTYIEGNGATSVLFIVTSESIEPQDVRDVTKDQKGRVIHERIIERKYNLRLSLIGPQKPAPAYNGKTGVILYAGYTWDVDGVGDSGNQEQKYTWSLTAHRSTLWPLTNAPSEVTGMEAT